MFLKCLSILGISMVPVIELRGAIPIGVRTLGVNFWLTVAIAVVGNLIPIPFLIVYGRRVLEYFASFEKFGKPFRWILSLGEKKVAKMKKTLFVALWLFVAVPLPGTGAWTGALVALTLNLKLRESFPAIALGVVTAGAIVSVVTYIDKIIAFIQTVFA